MLRLLLFFPMLTGILASGAGSQCPRPPIPAGGFDVHVGSVESVTYSDGVVAEGVLRTPTAAAPTCGWPLVVYVHSLASTRDQDRDWQLAIAARGFAVWAYDVRGQGIALRRSPNPGRSTLYGGDERFDLAEQIAHVGQRHAGLVDAGRIAVIGDSQGGVHGWMAAVQSGRNLVVPGRGEIPFPTIACVAPADYVPEPTWHRIRNGEQFSALFLDTADPPPGIDLCVSQPFADAVLDFFEQDDPAGCAAFLLGDPSRALGPELTTLTVPVLCRHAWHDGVCGAGPLIEAFESIPSTTPAQLIVSTVGHGSPANGYELAFKRDLVDRWLDRFLWNEDNGVDREPRYVFGSMPVDADELFDPTSLWGHVHVAELPAQGVVARRLWLRDDGALSPDEPVATAVAGTLQHRNPNGIDRVAWRNDRQVRELDNVLAAFPLSELSFATTVTAAADLIGATRIGFAVRPGSPRYALAALLFARTPGRDEVMLAHWGISVRDAEPGVVRRDEFELSPIVARLPVGTELRLVIRNLWIPESPHVRGVVAVPEFLPSDVEILCGPGADGSWCELPLRAPGVSLVASRTAMSLATPERVEFTIDAGPDAARYGYVFAGSGSGQTPGLDLPGGTLPIRVDPWFEVFGWIANTPEFPGYLGELDGDGRAAAALDLTGLPTLPPDLLGTRFTFAVWTYGDPMTMVGRPSNPVEVLLR